MFGLVLRNKYIKLQNELIQKEEKIYSLEKDIKVLKSKISGERTCRDYCKICLHSIENKTWNPIYGETKNYICELDCNCKDFEKR